MKARCKSFGILMFVLALGAASRSWAAPWEQLLTLSRVEADPQKPYALSDENGPWMIMACSFSGEQAAEQARELVQELRQRYKLPAYVYEKTFEFGEGNVGRGIDQYGSPLKMRYQRGAKIDEYAVLVGNYHSVDDPQAQETLKRLKYFWPDCLELDKSKQTARNLAAWRLITGLKPSEEKKKGPMGSAFLTTNPALPKEYFTPQGIDQFVQAMNEGIEHSLLDCPSKFTVQVAHFTGNVVLDQQEIQDLEAGKKEMESRLIRAGEDAEKLAKALRIKGYEAYVFHDRSASIVTVGSFDWAVTPRADGKDEINPKMLEVIDTFRAEQKAPPVADNLPADFSGRGNVRPLSVQPKTLVGIPFDIQPIPVQVPKRSIAADYSQPRTALR